MKIKNRKQEHEKETHHGGTTVESEENMEKRYFIKRAGEIEFLGTCAEIKKEYSGDFDMLKKENPDVYLWDFEEDDETCIQADFDKLSDFFGAFRWECQECEEE